MAAGAFLLAFGALMIWAIPFTFLLYGVGTQNGNLASMFAVFSVILGSVGAALLAYGVGAK